MQTTHKVGVALAIIASAALTLFGLKEILS
jgi:hypothetical protein